MFSILTQIMLKLSFYTQLYTYLKLGQLKKIVAKKILLEQFLICAYDHSPIKRGMSTGCAKLIQFRTQTSVSCVESATILACKRVSRVWRVPPSLHVKECLVCEELIFGHNQNKLKIIFETKTNFSLTLSLILRNNL